MMDKVYDQREGLYEAQRRGADTQQPQPIASQIHFLGNMEKLSLDEGDIVVLQLDSHLSVVQFDKITEKMTRIFGKGRCVVLDKGTKLGVVSSHGNRS